MYHTALIVITTLSRSAGPVCITRAAMRPAKSFWKKVQPWRTTCQWFCQRTRLVSPGTSAWLVISALAKWVHGRSTRISPAIAASCQPASRQIAPPSCAVTSVTTRPRHPGIAAAHSATASPVTTSAINRPGICRMKCQ